MMTPRPLLAILPRLIWFSLLSLLLVVDGEWPTLCNTRCGAANT